MSNVEDEVAQNEAIETEHDNQKKPNEDFVDFVRRCSETDAPRYTVKLRNYIDFRQKRNRAEQAKRKYQKRRNSNKKAIALGTKKKEILAIDNEKEPENVCSGIEPDVCSRSSSGEPLDCGRRRRRRSCRRRRRRSCRRRRRRRSCRRRRRSCRRRRRSCRRRRRSCRRRRSRRRRRRSCRRRRTRRRRCRRR